MPSEDTQKVSLLDPAHHRNAVHRKHTIKQTWPHSLLMVLCTAGKLILGLVVWLVHRGLGRRSSAWCERALFFPPRPYHPQESTLGDDGSYRCFKRAHSLGGNSWRRAILSGREVPPLPPAHRAWSARLDWPYSIQGIYSVACWWFCPDPVLSEMTNSVIVIGVTMVPRHLVPPKPFGALGHRLSQIVILK